MKKIKIEIDPEKLVIVTGNDGGFLSFLSGNCIACGASGWIVGKLGRKTGSKDRGSDLVHKPSCPVNNVI